MRALTRYSVIHLSSLLFPPLLFLSSCLRSLKCVICCVPVVPFPPFGVRLSFAFSLFPKCSFERQTPPNGDSVGQRNQPRKTTTTTREEQTTNTTNDGDKRWRSNENVAVQGCAHSCSKLDSSLIFFPFFKASRMTNDDRERKTTRTE